MPARQKPWDKAVSLHLIVKVEVAIRTGSEVSVPGHRWKTLRRGRRSVRRLLRSHMSPSSPSAAPRRAGIYRYRICIISVFIVFSRHLVRPGASVKPQSSDAVFQAVPSLQNIFPLQLILDRGEGLNSCSVACQVR